MSWVNLIWVSEKLIETFYCMGQRAGERKFCILINENGKMTYDLSKRKCKPYIL